MDVTLQPGTYVIAVSGGVDSVSLLHMLFQQQVVAQGAQKYIVAHYEHGIRSDSHEDTVLVRQLASRYSFPFVYEAGNLDETSSEAKAREFRYAFLHKTKNAANARAIITAHHQDDVIETAIVNILRGTARKGLTALQDQPDIYRPLLNYSKQEVKVYAQAHHLSWREDNTNADDRYLRNYIRHQILPRFSEHERSDFIAIITGLRAINQQIDQMLDNQLHIQSVDGMIDRQWFIQLPHIVARETMATWLRSHGERNFDKKTLERLVIAGKAARTSSVHSISKYTQLRVERNFLALIAFER
jgi:tRNA(Ile)-lysidine synthetase-like protein